MWILAAFLAAVLNGVTSVIVKYGVRETDSTVATAIRTCAVLCLTWMMVLVRGSFSEIWTLSWQALMMVVLSGVTTSISWLSYFKALSLGEVNKVVAMDKGICVVLTVLLAVVLFGETNYLPIKLGGTVLMLAGILLMMEKSGGRAGGNRSWVLFAVIGPVFAAITAIVLRVVGSYGVESNLATAIRTCVVMVMVWGMVLAQKKRSAVRAVDRRELKFILASGVTNGAYWICNYYAISQGIVSVVAPIDKISVLVSMVLSWLVLREKFSRKTVLGVVVIVTATLLMTVFT